MEEDSSFFRPKISMMRTIPPVKNAEYRAKMPVGNPKKDRLKMKT